MKNLALYLPLFILFILSISCEKDSLLIQGRLTNSVMISPLMYNAFVEESDSSYQVGQELAIAEFASTNITSVGTISQGAAGSVLYLGIGKRPPRLAFTEFFPFSLKFRVDEMDPTIAPSETELLSYFAVGREFSFGEANGMAELGLLLPSTVPKNNRSRSDYLGSPEGMVTVDRIEPFVGSLPESAGGDQEYLMITFSYAGKIGIHNHLEEAAAEQLGLAYFASKAAWVEGTATLVLAVSPG